MRNRSGRALAIERRSLAATSARHFRAGIITAAVLLTLAVLAVAINLSFGLPFNLSLVPPGQDYAVKAEFTDANGVNRGADVVIAGHTVGQVTGVEVSGTKALVTMRVSPQYAPLHQFTTARVRYSTLLAQKYIEITPVNGGKTIASGGAIRSDSTLSPVDFDQFLSALDPQTRAQLQTLIQQGGGAVDGQQATINDLLAQLNGLSQESVAPLSTFHQHDPDIDRIVANLAVVSSRLGQSHQQLGDLVGSMSQVTGTLATNDQTLAALITHLGNVMGDFDATLAGNEKNFHTTVVTLDPLLGQLNGTLSLVYGDSQIMIGQVNTNNRVLQPELVSATSQRDGDGNILRQFFVVYPACDPSPTPLPQSNGTCQTGPGAAPGSTTPTLNLPALPALPTLPALPKCLPTPTPPKLPTPTVSPLPCPSLRSPTATPSVPCMPTPTPPKLPTPTPTVSCPSLPGLPLPLGSIPDWLSLLLSGGAP